MHQIRLRLGLRPRPRWGGYRPPRWIWGPLRGKGGAGLGKRRERGGEAREGDRREGMGGPKVTVEPGPLRALLRH